MAVYEYKAITKGSGKAAKGMVDADTMAQARQKLRDQGLFPTGLKETTAGAAMEKGMAQRSFGGRISTRDLALMTRQLATLQRAGIPLIESLKHGFEDLPNLIST